jgi:hypothetical protein
MEIKIDGYDTPLQELICRFKKKLVLIIEREEEEKRC